jgi:hypothetical protein
MARGDESGLGAVLRGPLGHDLYVEIEAVARADRRRIGISSPVFSTPDIRSSEKQAPMGPPCPFLGKLDFADSISKRPDDSSNVL